jgi:hypothetical protein
MACRALQSLSAVGNFKTRLAKGTNENLQQFRVHGHSEEMVARGIRNRGVMSEVASAVTSRPSALLLVFDFSRGAGLRMGDDLIR